MVHSKGLDAFIYFLGAAGPVIKIKMSGKRRGSETSPLVIRLSLNFVLILVFGLIRILNKQAPFFEAH